MLQSLDTFQQTTVVGGQPGVEVCAGPGPIAVCRSSDGTTSVEFTGGIQSSGGTASVTGTVPLTEKTAEQIGKVAKTVGKAIITSVALSGSALPLPR